MMAHGEGCSLWDDSVDWANLAVNDYGKIPDEKSVMTTWHDNESLSDVFYFAKMCALPFSPNTKNIIILDITNNPREAIMLSKYEHVKDGRIVDKTDYIDLFTSSLSKFEKAASSKLSERIALAFSLFKLFIFCIALYGIIGFLLS